MKSIAVKLLMAVSLLSSLFFIQAAPMVLADAQGTINNGLCAGVDLQFTDHPGNCNNNTDATAKLNNLIHTIINLLSVIVGVVTVIMIIVGGFRYITSGGSDTGVTGAKNTI